jgi:predicted metal-binding protein
MECNELIALAKECGFTVAEPLDPRTLKFMPEVRDMCAADKCRNYARSWSCPPACGSLEEIATRCRGYDKGLLVQTIGRQKDEYDYETLLDTSTLHNGNFQRLTDVLHTRGLDLLPMGAGGCLRCETCTYPDAPCRFPDLVFPSMEACGLLVSQVCTDNGVPYYYGPGTIAYVSCYLYK